MTLDEIGTYFDAMQRHRGNDMLREYLQYEILKFIFESKYAHKYTFLGETCLRIAYDSRRFSEDLDFDNVGLTQAEFESTAQVVKRELELRGFEVTITFAYKGAFHCKVRFPRLLHIYELSLHKEATMLIKLDTEKQHYDYERRIVTIDKFGIRTDIRAVPLPLLGSQKIAAILGRKRAKGRDFYDLHYILDRSGLDYGYLRQRFGTETPAEVRRLVADHLATLDFDALARDVRPFLVDIAEVDRVRAFGEWWETAPLG